jgi:hypothetical protein
LGEEQALARPNGRRAQIKERMGENRVKLCLLRMQKCFGHDMVGSRWQMAGLGQIGRTAAGTDMDWAGIAEDDQGRE